jgi:predicted RNA methylase
MKVDQDILEILQHVECRADQAVISVRHGRLDRDTYIRVNRVLELAGGKWNRSAKAHVFDSDAEEALEQVMLTGEILDAKQELGAFWTPCNLADKMARLARVAPGAKILEPSAGSGRIIDAVIKLGAHVRAVEVDQKMTTNLIDRGVRCICRDFLQITPSTPQFDAAIMNPPFGRRQDVAHITHAAKFVKPGGRLVAVASAGVVYRSDRAGCAFRELVDLHDGIIEPLPEGTFKESGTMVNTVLITMDF